MKKYIYQSLALALLCVSMLVITSCKDDDDKPSKPTVTLKEVGHANNKTAMRGNDMHLEAAIKADGLIKRIDIEIHQEGGSNYKIMKAFTEGKYIGVKNADFHEHIDIPAEAPLGAYHLHFTVTDQSGQTVMAEEHITVVENNGTGHDEEEHHHE